MRIKVCSALESVHKVIVTSAVYLA